MNNEDKAKELQRAYLKEWRAKNRDKTKEYRRRYWEKKANEAMMRKEAATDGG